MPFGGDTSLDFFRDWLGDIEPIDSNFYVLPVNSIDDIVSGILSVDAELAEVRIGFQRRRPFNNVEYYAPNSDGYI